MKCYEKNIHETMQGFPELRRNREANYYAAFSLLTKDMHARDRRKVVFEHFEKSINRENEFQCDENYKVSQELMSVLDEARELLELLVNWCDLCLPANEQSFAEAHRLKVQDFQDYLSSGLSAVLNGLNEINQSIEKRAHTLGKLFYTKDVLPINHGGWEKAYRQLLVHTETNFYLAMSKSWEKALEDYLLYWNYWRQNLENSDMVIGDSRKTSHNNYFG
ncbi:unnamed protein product [Chrysoparadoxa australica]